MLNTFVSVAGGLTHVGVIYGLTYRVNTREVNS